MTTSEPLFLTVEEVLAFHSDQICLFGGTDGVRQRTSLESAVAMPQASFGGRYLHADLFEMAAAYAFHIAENQPFVDGNKRTGLNAALSFLGLNGQTVLDPEGKLYDAMMAISAHQLDKKGLATLLCELSASEHEEENS